MAKHKLLSKLLSTKIVSRDTNSLLARLFRKIMMETGFINSADSLLETFVRNSKLGNAKGKEKTAASTQISTELMSWKVFVDNIFNYLQVESATIVIKLNHGKGKITVHELPMLPTREITGEQTNEQKHDEKVDNKLGEGNGPQHTVI